MSLLDVVVLIILAVFFFKGFQLGLVRAIGMLVGLVVGLWVAGNYYAAAGQWLVGWGLPEAFASAAGYIVMFIVATWGVSILVWMADRVFKFLAFVPGMKLVNSVLGGVLFLIEGIIIVGVALYVIGQFSPEGSNTKQALDNARVAPMVKAAAWVASPLIPTSIEQFKNLAPKGDFIPKPGDLGHLPTPQ
jgi:membrane protein required for colicin V production